MDSIFGLRGHHNALDFRLISLLVYILTLVPRTVTGWTPSNTPLNSYYE